MTTLNHPTHDKQCIWDELTHTFSNITDRLGMPIDKGILDTVVAFNAHGFETKMSCEGHVEERFGDIQYLTPYVIVDFGRPKKWFTNEDEIKQKIAKEYGLETINVYGEATEPVMAYWHYMNKHKPYTAEYLELEQKNKDAHKSISHLLEEFYMGRAVDPKYTITTKSYTIGFDDKPDINVIGLEAAKKDLAIKQAEMRAFGEFLKNKFFES